MREIDYKAKLCGNTIYTYSFYQNPSKDKILEDDDDFFSTPTHRTNSFIQKTKEYKQYIKDSDERQKQSFIEYSNMGLDPQIALVLSNCFFRFTAEHFGLYNINESGLSRSRRRLRDLIYSNYNTDNGRFLTLTYKNAQFNVGQLKYDLNLFIKRMKYQFKLKDIRYIAIPEKHQSYKTAPDRFGSYHFHILLFDTGYLDVWKLADIWGKGGVDIVKLYGNASGVAYYVSKYVTKDMSIDYGRRFLASESCLKPIITSDFSTLPLLQEVHTSRYTDFSGAPLVFTVNTPYKIC